LDVNGSAEMRHALPRALREDGSDLRGVLDVPFDEAEVAFLALEAPQIFAATIGEIVEDEDVVPPLEQALHDPAPDEAGSPRDEAPHEKDPGARNGASTRSSRRY
jgi:hypothetical protein